MPVPFIPTDDVMYRLLVQGVTDCAIYLLSPHGRVMNWNSGAERSKGYAAEEIIGRHYRCLFVEADRAAGRPEANLETARREGRFEEEGWRLRKDGSTFWASVAIEAIRDEGGRLIGFTKITRDVTERRRQSEALSEALGNLDLALSNILQGVLLLDGERRVVLANERFRAMAGIKPEELGKGAPLAGILRGEGGQPCHERFVEELERARRGKVPVIYDIALASMVCSVAIRAIEGSGWVATFDDVTEKRRAERIARFNADYDLLTELPNRASFNRHLEQALGSTGLDARCAVFHIDLDRFATINELYGQGIGDALILEVADRLRRKLGPNRPLFRLGADEFGVVVPDTGSLAQVMQLCETLIEAVFRPFSFGIEIGRVSVSIGVAVAPEMGFTASDIIRKAGIALSRAKQDGRGCARLYGEVMGETLSRRRSIEMRLVQALEKGEFALNYQPVVHAATGVPLGCEALLRWTPAHGGPVRPDEFVPIAESLGLIGAIGGWVLETACREAAGWPADWTVSVNVSALQMRDGDFVERVAAALAASGLPARRLELELTETAMIEDYELSLATLTRLRAMGVGVAVDDFGTGHSSLTLVQRLPLTRIKLDKSFVQAMDRGGASLAIIRAVARLGQELGLSVTAEGVETEAQLQTLREIGCEDIQGYLFSRPLPAQDLSARYLARARMITAAVA